MLTKEEEERLFDFLHQRFGIPIGVLSNFLWFKKGEHIYTLKKSDYVESAFRYKVFNVGIRVLGFQKDYFIFHRWFLGAFKKFITKSRLWINSDQLEQLRKAPIGFFVDISPGPVVLAVNGLGDVGMGYYKNGQLRAQGLWI